VSERLAGQHFVVTGAGTGIGRAIAQRLASEGAALTLMARRAEPLAETARSITAAGGSEPGCLSVDIRDRQAVDTAFARAAMERGPLDGLVANAGIGGPNAPGSDDRFDELVATNLGGTYNCVRAAEKHLAPGPATRNLVLISSVLGRIGVAGYTGYCASKTGVIGLARALAMELAPKHVQVNAVCPGWVDTAMAREGLEGMAKALQVSYDQALKIAMQAVPAGRMSRPEEVAGLVAFLLSPDAQGLTGQALDQNGGAFML
jgi:NAD(P)-dependent dehydrogenase (short-subunit alcohol dehydrogenase family)